jgi:hypothetical protein
MFLFTDTPAPDARPAAGQPVARALQNAATESGVSFDYLLRTADRESSLNPSAQARTSSASGLFQFVEQTWLGLLKTEGPGMGLGHIAEQISENGGRYGVADPGMRRAILDLRNDPDLSARMAGVLTTKNHNQLSRSIGRSPTGGELYIAHFLGASGAGDLIRLAGSTPDAAAARYFPDAAAANRSIFYERSGAPRTALSVYQNLVTRHAGAVSQTALPNLDSGVNEPLPGVSANSNAVWSGFASQEKQRGGLLDLFRSDGEPVSAAVRETWGRGNAQPLSALRPAIDPTEDRPIGEPISLAPPKSKKRLAATPQPIDDEPAQPKKARRTQAVGEPLDLMKFMRLRG